MANLSQSAMTLMLKYGPLRLRENRRNKTRCMDQNYNTYVKVTASGSPSGTATTTIVT